MLLREVGHVIEAEGQRLETETKLREKLVRVQRLPLEFQQEGVALDRLVKEECEIQVRARRDLRAPRAAQRADGKRFGVAQRALLPLHPVSDERGVNGRASRDNAPAILQIRTPDQRIIFREQPPKRRQRPALADHFVNTFFGSSDHSRSLTAIQRMSRLRSQPRLISTSINAPLENHKAKHERKSPEPTADKSSNTNVSKLVSNIK